MYAQQEENKPYANHVIDGLITTFFSYLIQNYEESVKISSANTGLNQRMVEIKSYIHLNYATTSLKQTAEHFYLSEPYLSSLIKQQTGQSFSDMLRQIRMQHARDLLLLSLIHILDQAAPVDIDYQRKISALCGIAEIQPVCRISA